MTLGLAVLVAAVLVIFGVLIGCTLSEWQLEARARRQAEMQRSLNRHGKSFMPQSKKQPR